MKNTYALFLFLFCTLQLVATHSCFAQTLTWVTDNTPGDPYIMGSGSDFQENPGIEIELYGLVAKKLGFQLEFKRVPWKLCLEWIKYNKVDGIFPASYKESRKEIGVYPTIEGVVDPTKKTRDNGYYLYKLQTSQLHWNGNAFENLVLKHSENDNLKLL